MTAPANGIPIIVLAGQSNAVNHAVAAGVENAAVAGNALLVQVAMIGSPLDPALDRGTGDWSAATAPSDGENLKVLTAELTATLNPSSPEYIPGAYLAGVVWVQGEADAWNASAAKNYMTHLEALDATLTAAFGTHEFVVSQLSNSAGILTTNPAYYATNWHTIQAEQAAFVVQNAHAVLVSPDTVAADNGYAASQMYNADGLHYSATSGFGVTLGTALGAAALTTGILQSESSTPTVEHFVGNDMANHFQITPDGIGQVYGAGGADAVAFGDQAGGLTLLGAGTDVFRVMGSAGGKEVIYDLMSVETVTLTSSADKVALDHGGLNIYGGGGNDTIAGSSVHDQIHGDDGNDFIQGGNGNDGIAGGAGFDKLYGGGGNDQLWGNGQSDYLYGAAGNDRLHGGTGNDFLYGGPGHDLLYGDGGDDVLNGGSGNDVLTGGAGADTFVFQPGSGADRITDFTHGVDVIDLTAYHITPAQATITAVGVDVLISLPHGDSVLVQHATVHEMDSVALHW
jgi:Ca2+-binding RTX toxin-like protein